MDNPKDKIEKRLEGGGGELFSRPDNHRSDLRLAARMVSLGVVDEEMAAQILRGGFRLAAASVQAGKAREYAAALNAIVSVARLELDTAKAAYLFGDAADDLPENLVELEDSQFYDNDAHALSLSPDESEPEVSTGGEAQGGTLDG